MVKLYDAVAHKDAHALKDADVGEVKEAAGPHVTNSLGPRLSRSPINGFYILFTFHLSLFREIERLIHIHK